MKIAYISGSTIPSLKANAVHVMKMCQSLSRHGKSKVTLYGKRGSLLKDPYDHYDVKNSFSLVRSWLGNVPLISGLLRLMVTFTHAGLINKPDAYYGRDATALLLLSIFNIPIFYEAHQTPKGRKEKFVVSRLIKSPSLKGVIVISNGLKEDFRTYFADYKKPILVAHDGANIPTSNPKKIPQRLWKGRRNITQVGYTGSLHKGKGMELIYDIAKLVPEMDFHVLGGTKKDKEIWEAKGIPSNLFMHGSKPHSEVGSYLAKFDITLAPYQQKIHIGSGADISRWISPMKLFEYMAARKPIICSDLPVLREIIISGKNGIMVSPNDPTAWVDALCDLSKSASFREAIGHEGYRCIQDKYSWDIRAENIIGFIKQHNQS